MENQIEIYQAGDGHTQIKVNFVEQTIWLNQKQISALFGTEVPAINKHIKNILHDGELKSESTISKMEIVQTEGRRQVARHLEVYNLDMILSIGYRVNSGKATQTFLERKKIIAFRASWRKSVKGLEISTSIPQLKKKPLHYYI